LFITEVAQLAQTDRAGLSLLADSAHPGVRAALHRVTEHRLAITAGLFGELGFDTATARRRALLAYSAYLGHAQLSRTTPGLLPAAGEPSRDYLDEVIRTLTAVTSGP
jgi:hypothetical protein